MSNEKNLIPLGDPRRTKSRQREIQSKGGTASAKNRSARAEFNRLLALCPEDVLSKNALAAIRKMGVDPNGKTFLELAAQSTVLQWILGDMKAGKLAMELAGQDAAAERAKLDRERLQIEKEKLKKDDGELPKVDEIMRRMDEEAKKVKDDADGKTG